MQAFVEKIPYFCLDMVLLFYIFLCSYSLQMNCKLTSVYFRQVWCERLAYNFLFLMNNTLCVCMLVFAYLFPAWFTIVYLLSQDDMRNTWTHADLFVIFLIRDNKMWMLLCIRKLKKERETEKKVIAKAGIVTTHRRLTFSSVGTYFLACFLFLFLFSMWMWVQCNDCNEIFNDTMTWLWRWMIAATGWGIFV